MTDHNTAAAVHQIPTQRETPAKLPERLAGSDLDRLVSDAGRLLETHRTRLIQLQRNHRVAREQMAADLDVALHELETKGKAEIRRLDEQHRKEVSRLFREIEGLSAMRDSWEQH